MEHAYAQALWNMIEAGTQPKKAVHALREMLVQLGRASLLPKIVRMFACIAERERARTSVSLSIARKKEKHKAKVAAKPYLRDMGIKADEIEISIDESLIGGWRLEGKEHLVDASWKKDLLSIYNRSTA